MILESYKARFYKSTILRHVTNASVIVQSHTDNSCRYEIRGYHDVLGLLTFSFDENCDPILTIRVSSSKQVISVHDRVDIELNSIIQGIVNTPASINMQSFLATLTSVFPSVKLGERCGNYVDYIISDTAHAIFTGDGNTVSVICAYTGGLNEVNSIAEFKAELLKVAKAEGMEE